LIEAMAFDVPSSRTRRQRAIHARRGGVLVEGKSTEENRGACSCSWPDDAACARYGSWRAQRRPDRGAGPVHGSASGSPTALAALGVAVEPRRWIAGPVFKENHVHDRMTPS
jgi:hypothetical protein